MARNKRGMGCIPKNEVLYAMSLTLLIPEARSILTNESSVTSLVPASKISFSQRPQGDQLPGIIIDVGTVEYEPTFDSALARTIYRIDFRSYTDTAETAATIHEAIKAAILAHQSNNFTLRLFDESYFVDVDMIHRTTLSVTFEYSA